MKFFKTLFLFFSGALLGALVFLWVASGEIYDYQDTFVLDRDGPSVDVVLCLAGGKKRIPVAVDLWEKLKNQGKRTRPLVLFFAGVGAHANEETLIEQGISKEIVKNMKKNENAQIFSSFVHQNQWKHVVLVTSGYHMKRSSDILRKAVGPDVTISTYTVDAEHFGRTGWHKDGYAIRVTMMEYIKWLFYRYSYS